MGQRIRTFLFVLIAVIVLYFVLIMVSNGNGLDQIILVPMLGIVIAFVVYRATIPLVTTPESAKTMTWAAYLMSQYGFPLVAIIVAWLILARPWQTTPSEEAVSRGSMGDAWPLTVEHGTLRCLEGGLVVFETNGQRYAVNGIAKTQTEYPAIDSIWADDSSEIAKKNLSPLIDRGLRLCE